MGRKEISDIVLEFQTPDYTISYTIDDIFSKRENLRLADITQDDIKEVKPAFFKIEDSFYTELGVAKPDHPTPGSLGWDCILNNGEKCSFQIISYYDFNLKKDHCNGLPHWNVGGRIIDRHGKVHLVRELKGIKHTIEKDYPWTKWTMKPGPEGKRQSVKIRRPKKSLNSKE